MRSFVRRVSIAVGAVVVGLTLLPAPAQATTRCVTLENARMCVDTYWPVGSAYYHGKASVRDVAGGPNLAVKVTRILLQHYTGSRWVTVRAANDYDGWHSTTDTGLTQRIRPCNKTNPVFRTVATFEWRGGQAGSRTLVGGVHGHSCG